MYHGAAMARTRTAIVLGGSGSVGTALLRELLHDDGFDAVITLSRRSLPEAVAMARAAGRTLLERLVPDMKPAPLAEATRENLGVWVLLFLLLFFGLSYLLKKEYWKDVH